MKIIYENVRKIIIYKIVFSTLTIKQIAKFLILHWQSN
jgi:hypothetical protein